MRHALAPYRHILARVEANGEDVFRRRARVAFGANVRCALTSAVG
jgi:phytoene/squalene synthetase